jgi:hypothetical protein
MYILLRKLFILSAGEDPDEDRLRLRMAYGMLVKRREQLLGLGLRHRSHLLGGEYLIFTGNFHRK